MICAGVEILQNKIVDNYTLLKSLHQFYSKSSMEPNYKLIQSGGHNLHRLLYAQCAKWALGTFTLLKALTKISYKLARCA